MVVIRSKRRRLGIDRQPATVPVLTVPLAPSFAATHDMALRQLLAQESRLSGFLRRRPA